MKTSTSRVTEFTLKWLNAAWEWKAEDVAAAAFSGPILSLHVVTTARSALLLFGTLSWLAFPAHLGAQQRTDLSAPCSSLFSKLAVDGKYLDGDRRVGHTSHRERAGGGIHEEFPKNTMTDTCNGKNFWPQPRAAGNGIGTPIIRVSC